MMIDWMAMARLNTSRPVPRASEIGVRKSPSDRPMPSDTNTVRAAIDTTRIGLADGLASAAEVSDTA